MNADYEYDANGNLIFVNTSITKRDGQTMAFGTFFGVKTQKDQMANWEELHITTSHFHGLKLIKILDMECCLTGSQ